MITYFLAKSYKSFTENITRNAVSIGIITIIFLVFSTYLLVISNFHNAFLNIAGNLRIYVHLDKIETNEAEQIKNQLLKIEGIKDIKINTSKDNFNLFKNLFINKINKIDNINNPFPPSLEVELKNFTFEEVEKIASKIKKIPKVDSVDYGTKWLKKASLAIKAFKKFGIFFLAILFSGLFMIIFNTSKLIFIARKNDLEILKIMGATNYFIMIPYVIESFFIGTISAIASISLLKFFWDNLLTEVNDVSFMFDNLVFLNFHEIIYFIIVSVSIVVFSAAISILKLLEEIR